jgi:hypothetical protein
MRLRPAAHASNLVYARGRTAQSTPASHCNRHVLWGCRL